MKFIDAQKVIAISAKLNYPPLLVIGKNQIGKTTMLKEISQYFPESIFVDSIDRGGLVKAERKGEFEKISTIFLGGVENIIDRKWEIARSSLAEISNMIDPAHGKSIIFQDFEKHNIIRHKINFIIAMTPEHYYRLEHNFHAFDFLNRFLSIEVERRATVIAMNEEFELEYFPDKNLEIPLLKSKRMYSHNPSHHKMLNAIYSGLSALGHQGRLELGTVKMPESGLTNRSKPIKHIYSPNSTTISGRMSTKLEKVRDQTRIEEMDAVQQYINERKEGLT